MMTKKQIEKIAAVVDQSLCNWKYFFKMRATYQNTKEGDKIVFKEAGPHWFLDRINNAKKLEEEKVYTVKEISVASSSTGVALEETGDLMYELGWFETLENNS